MSIIKFSDAEVQEERVFEGEVFRETKKRTGYYRREGEYVLIMIRTKTGGFRTMISFDGELYRTEHEFRTPQDAAKCLEVDLRALKEMLKPEDMYISM